MKRSRKRVRMCQCHIPICHAHGSDAASRAVCVSCQGGYHMRSNGERSSVCVRSSDMRELRKEGER